MFSKTIRLWRNDQRLSKWRRPFFCSSCQTPPLPWTVTSWGISGSVARPKKMNETFKSSFASLVVIVLSLFLRANAATSLIVACPLKCYIFAKKKSWIRTTYRTNPLCCVERWNGGAADACRAIVHGVKQTTALLLKTWWWRKHQGVAQFKSPLRSEDNHRIFDEILFKWKIGRTAGSYRPV